MTGQEDRQEPLLKGSELLEAAQKFAHEGRSERQLMMRALIAEVERLIEINRGLCSDHNTLLGHGARSAARLSELGESEWAVGAPAFLRDLPIRDLTFEIDRRVNEAVSL